MGALLVGDVDHTMQHVGALSAALSHGSYSKAATK